MRLNQHLVRSVPLAAGLCLSTLPLKSAHAQAAFTYNNGYGQSIDSTTGVVSGGTQYTYSSEVTSPYLEYSDGSGPNTVYGAALNTGVSQIYSSFTLGSDQSASLNTLSLDLYVKDPGGTLYNPTTQDPFSGAHIAVYDIDPNQYPDLSSQAAQDSLASHLVSPAGGFAINELTSASFTTNYRYAPSSVVGGVNMDLSRPIFDVGINMNGLTLTNGSTAPVKYYFVVSVDVDPLVAPLNGGVNGAQNAFSVLANPTDGTYGQPYTDSPNNTDGDNGIYNPGVKNPDGTYASPPGYFTDQPEFNPNNPNSPVILDAFPYSLTGTVDTMPEPGALALLGLAGFPTLGAVFLRNRRRVRGAKQAV